MYFNGRKYSKKNNGYWYRTLSKNEADERGQKRVSLHREVWRFYNGEIPEGFHIHHKDGDKDNNEIDNLEMLSSFKHLSGHTRENFENNKEKVLEHLGNVRHLTKEWHKSEEGLKWHREHHKKNCRKMYERVPRVCIVCGKDFIGKIDNKNVYCSNYCKSKARRDSGVDNIEKQCAYCGGKFIVNKYAKQTHCSRECGNQHRRVRKNLLLNG